jgi:hypothetical protein
VALPGRLVADSWAVPAVEMSRSEFSPRCVTSRKGVLRVPVDCDRDVTCPQFLKRRGPWHADLVEVRVSGPDVDEQTTEVHDATHSAQDWPSVSNSARANESR